MSATPPPPEHPSSVADLHPAAFAMVMATGIVSIAAKLRGYPTIAIALLWLNVLLYARLWLLTLIRFIRYRDRFIADALDHSRTVGFFTLVAGTCVLGNQFVIVRSAPRVAIALWGLGIVLWLVINYSVLTILTVKTKKPSLIRGLNGGWLVSVVATQAVALLGAYLSPYFAAEQQEQVLFFSLVMWLGGAMLYGWIIALIFYRYTFLPLDPRQLAPPYWINMGAMAISTLAGTALIIHTAESQLLTQLFPFLLGATLLFWATATWWIPLLVVLGVWRHVLRRVPLNYDVVYWSAVFPLGMYTVATHRLVEVTEQPWLDIIPRYFLYVALAAWAIVFAGFLHNQVRLFTSRA